MRKWQIKNAGQKIAEGKVLTAGTQRFANNYQYGHTYARLESTDKN
jgi:hypothetical protein